MITAFTTFLLDMSRQVDTLGNTLLHFLWEGALIGALAAGLLHALRRATARARYTAACLCLLGMAAAPAATYFWLQVAPAAVPLTQFSDSSFAAITESAAATAVPPAWMPLLVTVWLAGAVLLLLRLLAGWTLTFRLRCPSSISTPARWLGHVERLRALLRVGRRVGLVFTERVDAPAVTGWLRPVIVMPLHMLGLTPEQAEVLLAHELAHVRRHDALVNLFQRVMEAILFYHPAVWWLSARIRSEREHCCDDIAIAHCGDPMLYARTLVALEESRASLPTLAMAANGGNLPARIRRILGLREEASDPWTPVALTVLTVGLLLLQSPRYQAAVASQFEPEWDLATPARTWTAARLDTLMVLDEEPVRAPRALRARSAPARVEPVAMRISALLDADSQDSQAPAPPVPPVPPAAPAVPQAAPGPPAPPVPPAPPTRSHTWNWDWSRSGEGRVQMSNDAIRFIEDGKHYVIRDPALIQQARSLFAGSGQFSKEQREIGRKLREAARADSQVSRNQHREAGDELRRAMQPLQNQINSAALRRDTARIEELAREMAETARKFESRLKPITGEMEKNMRELESKMKAWGEEMRQRGEQMRKMNEDARRSLKELLKEAVKSGKAQPETL